MGVARHPACRAFSTRTPSSRSPASRFFEPAVIDEICVLDRGPQLAGQGQDVSLALSLSLSHSNRYKDKWRKKRHSQLVQTAVVILSPGRPAKKSISLLSPIISSICKIYSVIGRVNCFVRSECGHHDVATS